VVISSRFEDVRVRTPQSLVETPGSCGGDVLACLALSRGAWPASSPRLGRHCHDIASRTSLAMSASHLLVCCFDAERQFALDAHYEKYRIM
jgi:hypothetical protein